MYDVTNGASGPQGAKDGPAPSGNEVLRKNLVALSIRNQRVAREVAAATPSADLWLVEAQDGAMGGGLKGEDALAAILGTGDAGVGVQLASRYRPLDEAKALVETVDVVNAATALVLGFGLGHHVRLLSERLKEHGLVVVFEPDVGLLRAVMEQVDCASWLVRANVVFLTSEDDSSAIAEATRGFETMLTLGTRVVPHPPSVARLGGRAKTLTDAFTDVLRAARTHIVTTLVQTEITLRNLLQNLDHYVSAPGVDDLEGRCRGKPAIVVSAGPSLARTIDQLAQPGVRDRFVIVAAQTVLKQLLARGVKPHFVTALDHHEISRRFYEGLTKEDVEGVTLIAEAKANAAILDSFPGLIRCCADDVLDRVLGPTMMRRRGKLPPGATVAHLAYYVARHLGCDPVILTGQDLGFTDGQYYAAGAAIHNVWAGELSEFNTLEMMEWERIVRMRPILKRATDQLGRPVYTDEQMHTYLVQFERDFARDEARGLTTIDATEGGVIKRHARIETMLEATARFTVARGVEPDPLQPTSGERAGRTAKEPVERMLGELRTDVVRLLEHSKKTTDLLRQMLDAKGDQGKIGSLIKKVYEHRDRVQKLDTANWLVHFLNQCGTFRRLRADRAISLAEGLTAQEIQAKQIERDLSNVEWLKDAADQTMRLLDDAASALKGGPKVTRDDPGREDEVDGVRAAVAPRRVVATVLADVSRSALGFERDLSRELSPGVSVLRATVLRLSKAEELDGILVLTDDPAACAALVGTWAGRMPIEFVKADEALLRRHQRAMLAGRSWSRASWRGGVAGLTCFDEVCPAAILVPILESRGIDAACVVGGDWAMVDWELTDSVVARHREAPARHRLTFSQGVPGIAPAVLDTTLLREIASADHHFGSVGGLLRYVPIAPQADAIARAACVQISTVLRDAGWRCVCDSDEVAAALESQGEGWIHRPTLAIVEAIGPWVRGIEADRAPEAVRIELTDGVGGMLSLGQVQRVIEEVGACDGVAVTLCGAGGVSGCVSGEPHPHVLDIIAACRQGGIEAIHVRASLAWPREVLYGILESGVQVMSVDVEDPTGSLEVLDELNQRRREMIAGFAPGLPPMWIVPRITRRDGVYESVEQFYDACVMAVGACAIDPLPRVIEDERIGPLPLPVSARLRLAHSTATVSADGVWRAADGRSLGAVGEVSLKAAWRAAAMRDEGAVAAGVGAP